MEMERSSGILLPVSSLPSPYGIGTLGKEAYDFIDFLAAAGQSWWQILPAGPTSMGDSPYQSPSAHAGNPYFIDPELLAADGLLDEGDAERQSWGDDPERVDYGMLFENRPKLLKKAKARGFERDAEKVKAFSDENPWLEDYALYMAVKEHFGMSSWQDWPDDDIRLRKPEALKEYRKALKESVEYYEYIQYLFFKQWNALKSYAHSKGVGIIGDMPLYVALDSADVWSSPEYFQLDDNNVPVKVSGVPPDLFTEDGQLWGNPLYDYEAMEKDGFRWWISRIKGAAGLYDVIRIDHFRGLESYWAVPNGETTAKNGVWIKGPGMSLIGKIKENFPETQFIAEDLGYLTPEVRQLLKDSGFPGMQVLQFSFDSRDEATTLPEDYAQNCVCYAGTHDNDTLAGWKKSAAVADIENAKACLGLQDDDFVRGMLKGGMSTAADLFIAQMQDWLELGSEARINTPGTTEGNWQWRLKPGQIPETLKVEIAEITAFYGRRH